MARVKISNELNNNNDGSSSSQKKQSSLLLDNNSESVLAAADGPTGITQANFIRAQPLNNRYLNKLAPG